MNPVCFQPFGGPADDARIEHGEVSLPDVPGIGFERKAGLMALFDGLPR